MNNNFMRAQQGNRNRNRNNRTRHRSTGGNGSGGGGNSANKVFDSNGPDVKLRGTAQTIAEKYMQLGRDSQSSGDSVAAENYYQHAEHYYRIWAANQPVGQSLQMSRKLGEDEFEDDNGQDQGDDEGAEGQMPEAAAPADSMEASTDTPPQEGQPTQDRQDRNARNPRDGGRERFRPRWQNRRDRPGPEANREEPAAAPAVEPALSPVPNGEPDAGHWEAPSFLQRPSTVPAELPVEAAAAVDVAPRPARTRRPRETTAAPASADETPQGD